MFGKKKNKTDDVAAESPEKASKAPKAAKAGKAKKGGRKVPKGDAGFFALHIEKLVLVAVLAGVGYFIYAGFSAKGYDTSRAPEKLQSDASSLLTQIKQDHWEAMREEREVSTNYQEKVQEEVRKPIPLDRFATKTDLVWGEPPINTYEKRGDPEIFAPEDLVVKNVHGALAIQVPKDQPDPFEAYEQAPPIKVRGRSRRNTRGGGDAGGYGGGYGGSGYGGGGYGGGDGDGYGGTGQTGGEQEDPPRFLNGEYDLGATLAGGMGGMGGMGGGGMMGGGMMGGGMMGGGMMGGGMMGGGMGRGPRDGLGNTDDDKGPKFKLAAKPVMFNAITALVPHKRIFESYKANLENTGQFMAMRDLPVYLSFEVQRVDVTNNPARDIQDNEWKTITNGVQQVNLPRIQKWATRPPLGRGPVPEVIERNSVHRGLTMPIPPMLVNDYRHFSRHPAIDWSWNFKPLRAPVDPQRQQQGDEGEDEIDPTLPGARGGAGAGPSGGMMGGGMMGGGMMGGGMMGGEGYGGGGYGGGGYGGGGYGAGGYGGGYGGGGYGDEGDGYGGDGYGGGMMGGMMGGGMMGGGMMGGGMMGGGMMGGYGGGYGGGSPATGFNAPQSEFKMVRCYDMSLNLNEVGKVYRYRIRLIMRDPNYPEDGKIPMPAPSDLKEEVWSRVAVLQREDDIRIEKDEKALRTLRETEWSEPSPPVRVEAPFSVYAGNVEFAGPKTYVVGGSQYSVSSSEPQGTVVVTAVDFRTGAELPLEEEVLRGSVLNSKKKADIEFIVPTTKMIKVMKDREVNSMATVVDMRGGIPLEGESNYDPQTEIGEMLIVHGDGRIEVTSDFRDQLQFRRYTFAEEKEQAEANPGAGGGMGDMGGYGGSGYGGD